MFNSIDKTEKRRRRREYRQKFQLVPRPSLLPIPNQEPSAFKKDTDLYQQDITNRKTAANFKEGQQHLLIHPGIRGTFFADDISRNSSFRGIAANQDFLVTCQESATPSVHDISTGQRLFRFPLQEFDGVFNASTWNIPAAFSKCGKFFATSRIQQKQYQFDLSEENVVGKVEILIYSVPSSSSRNESNFIRLFSFGENSSSFSESDNNDNNDNESETENQNKFERKEETNNDDDDLNFSWKRVATIPTELDQDVLFMDFRPNMNMNTMNITLELCAVSQDGKGIIVKLEEDKEKQQLFYDNQHNNSSSSSTTKTKARFLKLQEQEGEGEGEKSIIEMTSDNSSTWLCCSYSPYTGNKIAIGTLVGAILIFSSESGTEIQKLEPHKQHIYRLIWTKNENFLFSSSFDAKIAVTNLETRNTEILLGRYNTTQIQISTKPNKKYYHHHRGGIESCDNDDEKQSTSNKNNTVELEIGPCWTLCLNESEDILVVSTNSSRNPLVFIGIQDRVNFRRENMFCLGFLEKSEEEIEQQQNRLHQGMLHDGTHEQELSQTLTDRNWKIDFLPASSSLQNVLVAVSMIPASVHYVDFREWTKNRRNIIFLIRYRSGTTMKECFALWRVMSMAHSFLTIVDCL